MDKEILVALEDSEFAEKILDCISPEEVQEYFEEIGINISDTDANRILCSVYGVEEEAAFVSDYDLAICVGGKDDSKESLGKNSDDVVEAIIGAVGKEKLEQQVDKNKDLYMKNVIGKVDNPKIEI